ncbi:MAG TPA: restriction endonuclease [bacterium]|nr:restriction endonuclease [bacterium]
MAIPDYQTIMLPLLKHLSDNKIRSSRETFDALANEFNLTEEERKELLPSGQQLVFLNRISWAKVYLKKAGLIESPRRGYFKITESGIKTLNKSPEKIDNDFLKQFKQFRKFMKNKSKKSIGGAERFSETDELDTRKTPEEYLEYGYQQLHEDLSNSLLEQIKSCSATFFEKLVVELLLKMGYGGSRKDAGRTIGKTGDGGIDGIIKEDKLGLDVIYIQAKRWEGTVGRPEIQKFAGALQGQRAKKGIFITTSSFSKDAEEYASMIENKIVLIDGEQLSNLMIDFDIGVNKIAAYEIKRIDTDYFTEESYL